MSVVILGAEAMIKYVLLSSIVFLVACGSSAEIEPVKPVEVRTLEVEKPAPVVPTVDQLRLREVKWVIITPENAEEKFAEIKKGEVVLFALTPEGYENIALNLSDIRALIEQQKKIIAIYESQYK
jgi:hypothetical protein